MAKLPFMRLYVNNLIGDTTTLSDAEFGSYVIILLAMWKAGGWLTQDQARKASKCAAGRWAKRWAAIGGYFEVEDDGRITHSWVREDLEDLGRSDDRRSKGAPAETTKQVSAETTKSGPKPLKTHEPDPPLTRDPARKQKAEGRRQKEVEDSPAENPQPPVGVEAGEVVVLRPADDWPRGEVSDWVKALCCMSGGRLDPDKNLQLHTSVGVIGEWHRAGYSWSLDVLPAVLSVKKSRERIGTWAYLDPIVRKLVARRLHAARPIDPSELTATGDRHDDKLARKNDNLARARAAGERLDALYAAGGGGGGEFD